MEKKDTPIRAPDDQGRVHALISAWLIPPVPPPAWRCAAAAVIGVVMAVLMRVGLLFSISWLISLTAPVLNLWTLSLSWRDIILIGGGLFLLFKSTLEIGHSLEGAADESGSTPRSYGFMGIILQIAVIDIVFSLDSVITAVGLVQNVPVMVAAIVISVVVMMLSASTISEFIDKHPSLKMLALSFLMVVGTMLVAEAFEVHVPKGYIYFAMAFSLSVEALNIRMRVRRERRMQPVQLHKNLP